MSVLKIKDSNNQWVHIPTIEGEPGDDGITPVVNVTSVTGGHNVAFSYGSGDSRNTNFDVMDGEQGDTGESGVYIGTTAPSDPDVDVWIKSDGTDDYAQLVSDVTDAVMPHMVTVSGTNVSITGVDNTIYLCGEVSTISITPPQSGIIDVIFTSGTSAAVLTLPNTVKMPSGFDPANLDTSTTYEINILNGVYGAVMSWS